MSSTTINGGISFWYAQDGIPTPREPLPGDASADVVHRRRRLHRPVDGVLPQEGRPFLRDHRPGAEFCGYGASGRNGGWLYNGIAGRDRYARLHGHEAAVRLQQAMNDTVDEVVAQRAEENIDADIHQGGVLEVAYTPAQFARLKAFHAAEVAFGESDRVLYGADETAERIRVAERRRLHLDARTAPALHPVKLLKGLAAAVEALGVTIHESTPVTEIRPKHARHPVRHGPRPVRTALHRGLHRLHSRAQKPLPGSP